MELHHQPGKVAVLDRHALFRRGVVDLMREARPAWQVTETDSLDALDDALGVETTTVVLTDLAHPGVVAAGGIAGLIAAHSGHLFVGLSDDADSGAVLDCLTTGARGYLLRSTQPGQFLRALDTVLDGGVYAPAVLRPVGPGRSIPLPQGMPMLTGRQRDVLDLLREGCPTKTIARRLDLAVGTVKVHLAGIYRALGASSRLEAVAKAQRISA